MLNCFSVTLCLFLAAFSSFLLHPSPRADSFAGSQDEYRRFYDRRSHSPIISLALFFPVTGLDVGTETISFSMRYVFPRNRRQQPPTEVALDIGVPCSISEGLTLAAETICAGARCRTYESSGDGRCVGKIGAERITRTIRIPFGELTQMAEARSVSLEFGAGKYWLSRRQKGKLKQFVSQLVR